MVEPAGPTPVIVNPNGAGVIVPLVGVAVPLTLYVFGAKSAPPVQSSHVAVVQLARTKLELVSEYVPENPGGSDITVEIVPTFLFADPAPAVNCALSIPTETMVCGAGPVPVIAIGRLVNGGIAPLVGVAVNVIE